MFAQGGEQGRGRQGVGDEVVGQAERADGGEEAAGEFGGVCEDCDLAGLLGHLRDHHGFGEVCRGKTAFGVNGSDAEEGEVGLDSDLACAVWGGEGDGADGDSAGKADVAADHVDVAAAVGVDGCGDDQGVCGDDEFASVGEVGGQCEGGGASVDEEDGSVVDEAGGEACDGVFLVGAQAGAVVELGVVPGDGGGGHGSAVSADEDAFGVELVEVAADGVDGDAEASREVGHRHLADFGDVGGDVAFSSGGESRLCVFHDSRITQKNASICMVLSLCNLIPVAGGNKRP